MGLFSFFKKKAITDDIKQNADLELIAPVSGTLVSLKQVPDLVISEKLIGDGIAIVPDENIIRAPCSGIVSRLLTSNNAFAIRHETGIEIYVSFGIGSNSFSGEGMSSFVTIGDNVQVGDKILNIELDRVQDKLESTVTSIIAVRSSAKIAKVSSVQGKVQGGKTPCTWIILADD